MLEEKYTVQELVDKINELEKEIKACEVKMIECKWCDDNFGYDNAEQKASELQNDLWYFNCLLDKEIL